MKGRRFFAVFLSLLIVLLSCGTAMAADNNIDIDEAEENYGYIPDIYDSNRLETPVILDEVQYPSKYDPRQSEKFTIAKEQEPYKLCWMYAFTAAVEQNIVKNFGRKFDISEAHGAVAMSNSIKPLNSNSTEFYNTISDIGGHHSKAAQYFTNWNTPIFSEETVKWNSAISELDYDSKSNLPSLGSAIANESFSEPKSIINVTDAFYIEKSELSIKAAVNKYGAVSTYIRMGISNISGDDNGDANFYDSNKNTSGNLGHAVTIIGWDDNYSKDNFCKFHGVKPISDGAWLVKNSSANHGCGFVWVSYEEPSLYEYSNKMIVVSGVQNQDDNEYMLSYDYLSIGCVDNNYRRDKTYICNVYDVREYLSEYDRINKVMLYLKMINCSYTIKIIDLGDNDTLPTNLSNYIPYASGTYSGEGYLTVDLVDDYIFNSNNKIAVIVEIDPIDNSSKIYLPSESRYGGRSNESFYCINNENEQVNWKDYYYYGERNSGNFCIRPILKRKVKSIHNITLSQSQVIDTSKDSKIRIDSDSELFSVQTKSNLLLQEDVNYTCEDMIDNNTNDKYKILTIKKEFLQSLNGAYTELVLEFNNDITKTLAINPKSVLDRVEISGKPIIGETLSAVCYGVPPKDEYDVTYQWYSSPDGKGWYKIGDATSKDYTVGSNVKSQYIRVEVTAKRFGNVEYPIVMHSEKTNCKAVLLGDVDMDGEISVKDATAIQKYLVQLITFNDEQKLAADFNKDGEISVRDATALQKYIVGLQ